MDKGVGLKVAPVGREMGRILLGGSDDLLPGGVVLGWFFVNGINIGKCYGLPIWGYLCG